MRLGFVKNQNDSNKPTSRTFQKFNGNFDKDLTDFPQKGSESRGDIDSLIDIINYLCMVQEY